MDGDRKLSSTENWPYLRNGERQILRPRLLVITNRKWHMTDEIEIIDLG